MIKEYDKRKFLKAFLMFISVLLVVHTILLSPLETFAKEKASTSSESSHVINETDSSVIKKGIPELEKKVTLQKEQPKSEEIEESESSKEPSSKKENRDSNTTQQDEEKEADSEKGKKKGEREFATMEGGTVIATFNHTDGLRYTVWSDGKAGVVGFSGNAFANITIPATVPYGGKNYKVVHIYKEAFQLKSQIKTLAFASGSNLEQIETKAFYLCTNLTSVYFSTCTNLQAISSKAFEKCGNLTRLDFSKCTKLKRIESYAFQECKKLASINFSNCSSLQQIGGYAFQYSEALTSLDFSDCNNLTIIDEQAFAGSRKLSPVKFPSQSILRTIGNNAFRNCDGFAGSVLKIPDSVRNIGEMAFILDDFSYKEVHHQKVASVNGSLPSLEVSHIDLPEEADKYESKVDSSKDKTLLHKAAKWTNEDRTTAEIRLDYGYNFDRLAKVDVIFVMDYSSSMTKPATAKNENGTVYNFPRGFLTDDIVYDASKMLVDSKTAGYDNQIAMVGFAGKSTPHFKSNGYTNNTEDIKKFLIEHPNIVSGETHYGAGLQGAIDILNNYPSGERIPAVIFLSDGYPNVDKGVAQADILRARGVNVYPIAIYTDGTATQALKNISFDKKTAYVADDTDTFEKIMTKVVHDVVNHAEPLDVQIEDILSDKFEVLTGDDDLDYELSPDGGKVTRQGRKITWNLDGCAQGVAHTLKIKVKVKEGTELSATGVLPTNDSMIATNDSMGATNGRIESKEQPQLDRYLAHHRFENEADPNANLPEEVMDLLPSTKGGYGKGQRIEATKVDPTEVKTKDGRTWKFIGWDEEHKTIVDGDVTFVGKWRFIGYDFSFIKLDNDGAGLEGAEFSLYLWKGSGDPTNSDLATKESIAAGKWSLIDKQVSQQNGRVDFYVPAEEGKYFQLAETQAPTSYAQPQGQWRFTFDVNGHIENNQLVGIGGQNNTLPPPFEVIEEGEFKGYLGVKNKPAGGQLPATGGLGRSEFTIKAAAFCSIGLLLGGLYLFFNRRK